ncbi:tetratricopeptide repeat protein [Dolichospermum sp. UHCC 0684]|uniref:tetratricopeptide repeat protein n=1 Tax=Dolichospermum sp. UHCC 0684 TaxID=3110242 RepID=UPI002B217289|nr:tetratricopeptide repeat protein [Dolichospermum sp. UHCC 0684]MEA5531371.1 tetratricopeptide repeat protein [Dolichospermum sp. UHCC 0684]
MDWTTILKAQQTDFIQRLKSGDLLHCEKEGQHSELTVISGERLQQLRDFCWDMAEKYRHTSSTPIRDVVINNFKGKLGEEVVKSRLGDFVTEVDYKKRKGGDGKVDFTLTSDSSIGIQVKTRYGNFDKVQWSIDREEIEKNAVLICILCQEEFSENEKEYRFIIAGFLPTNMIKSTGDKTLVGIDELLYPGGLRGYLESFIFYEPNDSINSGYNLALIYDQQAMACRESKDYLGALSNYNKAIFSNPNISAIYNNRGLIHEALGNTQSAIDDYTQALLINPSLTEAYYNRGDIRNNLGDTQGAIDDYTQALLINPADTELYYKRGLAHSYLGDNQAAISDYTQAIKLDSNYIDAYYERAEIYSKLGYKLAAIEDLTKIINIAPNEVSACWKVENIYYNLGLYQDAIWLYTQIIEILPTDNYAYYNRGVACYNLGDNQGAIEDFTYLIKLSPRDANNYYYRGLARFNAGDNRGAIQDLSTMIAINSNDAQAYFKRGLIYYNLELYQDAIRDYNQAIKILPNCANTYYNRGLTLLSLKNQQAAIDDFKKAAHIYKQENNINDYNETLERLEYIQCVDVELKSAVNMNYTRLRDLLAAGKWKEADEETTRVMLAVAKREYLGSLDFNSINNFPCEDLRTIDQLWVKYSNERFGFSIQKRIYQNVGGTNKHMGETNKHNRIITSAFGYAVGWKTATEWFYYGDITFNINAPKGHLPRQILVEESNGFLVCFFYIFSRVETCNI